jgi:hypothetical protein
MTGRHAKYSIHRPMTDETYNSSAYRKSYVRDPVLDCKKPVEMKIAIDGDYN